jgi:phenylpyruvate tautomerase PptA (4-oxalocrotonate tautomerase family)
MPLVRVELFERRLDPELESKLIERMTETLLEALEAPELSPSSNACSLLARDLAWCSRPRRWTASLEGALREHTWVIVEGHDAHRWGRNAKPWDEGGD